jgi:TP901 family phage tail tape measure protein
MINFGKNTQWTGRQLMVGFTVPLTIFGAVAGKTFRELEKEAVNFKKVYGDSFTPPEEMQANLDAVKELAKEYTKYGIAVKDTIGLAAEAAAAGAQNQELLDATTQATRLATLGQMEQNEALKTTISLQNAFKLSGDELAKSVNFLNMVENQTVVTLQDLSGAIPRVAPVIKGLGGDVEDLAAFLAAMQEGGVSAAQGAQALKSGLASLINPTDKAKEKLQGMGISLDTIIQANRGDLMGTVQALADAFDTLDQFSRQQAIEEIFGKFQYARLAALFDNINKEGTQAARVLEMTGMSAAEMAASAEKELSAIEEAVGTKFTAAMEKLQLAIAPIGEMFTKLAIPVINFLSKVADAFNNLPDFAKKFIGLATVVVGLVIPAGTMFLGLLVNLVGTLTKFGAVTGSAFRGFLSGGIKGAFDAVSQSVNYMSLEQIDAATASQQLAGSTEAVNAALLGQVGASEGAQAAVMELAYAYEILTQQMREAAAMNEVVFGTSAAAMGAAGTRGPRVRRNRGGTIPGSGNTDTVPAMLTPGEFVVNKQATQDNLPLLRQINESGKVPGYFAGGIVARLLSMFRGRAVTNTGSASGLITSKPSAAQAQVTLRDLGTTGTSLPIDGQQASQRSQRARTMQNVQRMHLRESPKITSLGELRSIDGYSSTSGKYAIAEALIEAGIPIDGMTGDWVTYPKQLNQAARRNSNTPMTVRDAAKFLQSTDDTSFVFTNSKGETYQSVFPDLYPGVSEKEFSTRLARRLRLISIQEGKSDQFVTDALIARARDLEFPRLMDPHLEITGIRLPTKGDLARLTRTGLGAKSEGIEDAINEMLIQRKSSLRLNPPGTGRAGTTLVLGEYEQKVAGTAGEFGRRVRMSSGGAIVPGQGNKDTVPAMLTPGEFVVNKKATQSNMALLKAINDGTIRGYAAGDVVGDKRNGFYAEGTNGMKSGPFPTRRMARKEAKQIVRNLGTSRSGGMGMRGMGLGMGMGMAGGAMFMGAGMMPNETSATAMQMGGTALSLASMLPMIPGAGAALMSPPGLVVAGIAAAAAAAAGGLYLLRKSLDESAKKTAEFAANLGGTANSLNTIAEISGQQTPLQRRKQVELGLTQADMENLMSPEMSAMLSSESGQKLITELEAATSAEKFQKLADYLKYAIASGLMDQQMAQSFAKGVAYELNDSLLSSKVVKTLAGQETGSGALVELAGKRSGAAESILSRLEDEVATGFERRAAAGMGRGTGPKGVRISENVASSAIGVSIQALQDYSNAQALAQEELANGTITQEEFNTINNEIVAQQNKFSVAIESSIQYVDDIGAAMQATKDQLVLAGIVTEEQFKSMEEAASVSAAEAKTSQAVASELTEGLKGAGVAALAMGTDINLVNYGLQQLANAAEGSANQLNASFEALRSEGLSKGQALTGAITETQIRGLVGGGGPIQEARFESQLRGFIQGGGDQPGLQAMLGSMSRQDARTTMENLGGLGDVTTQNKFISDFQNLTSLVDAEYAKQVVNSKEYLDQLKNGETELIETIERASGVFGASTKEISDYADKSGVEFKKLVEYGEDLQGIPQELLFSLGIDITNPQDLQKFGPVADSLRANWPILQKLNPNIDLKLYIDYLTLDAEGNPIDPMTAAKRVKEINNAWKKFEGAETIEARKTAYLELMTLQNGQQVDSAVYDEMWNALIADFGQARVANMPADRINKIFEIDAEIKGLETLIVAAGKAAYALGLAGDEDGMNEQLQKIEDYKQRIAGLGGERVATGMFGKPRTTSGGGGGGQKEKTIPEMLKKEMKLATGFANEFGRNKIGKIMGKPFGPEFLEFIKSQGEKGLKFIKGNFKKFKDAYNTFEKTQKALSLQTLQFMPGKLAEKLQGRKDNLALVKMIAQEEGMSLQTAIEAVNVLDANQQKEYLRLVAKKKLTDQEKEHLALLKQSMGIAKETALFDEKNAEVMKFMNMSAEQRESARISNLMDIQNINRQIEEIKILEPLQKQLDAQQKILDAQQRTIDLKQREVDNIGRTIELEERKLEPLDDQIEKLEEQKDSIQETYDNQIEALDKIFEREENIIALREKSLDVADALSSGDIAAAARAQMQLQSELAAQRREDQRSLLEAQNEAEIAAIDEQINDIKEQRVAIEKEVERLQLKQRSIQDEIYKLNQNQIPVQDEIYRLQQRIASETDRLNSKYNDTNLRLQSLNQQLKAALETQNAINNAAAEENRIRQQKAQQATSYDAPQFLSPGDAGYDQTTANIQELYGGPSNKMVQLDPNMGLFGPGTQITLDFGAVFGYAMGGKVNYKGSREPAPGFMYGGKMKKFASGSWVPGSGMLDGVPAMLTPGEFVVRKPVAQTYGNLLQSLNGQVFPRVNFRQPMPNGSASGSGSMYNYNVNVTLNGSDMNPDDVANAVMKKIKMTENTRVRGYNTRG